MPFLIALDVGTSSVKSILLDVEKALVIGRHTESLRVLYPRNGWAEQSPDEIWESIVSSIKNLLEEAEINRDEVKGISIDAQMLGVVPVSRDGEALHNFLTWLDTRGAGEPWELFTGVFKISGYNLLKLIKYLRITGGAPSRTGKDPISKIVWFRKNMPELYEKTWKFLNYNGFVALKLTGKPSINADEANVTWLADVRRGKLDWSVTILKDLKISSEKLPPIRAPTEIVGGLKPDVAGELGLSESVKVVIGSGDVAATAIGSGGIGDLETHLYLGTSDWLASHLPRRRLDIFHAIGTIISAIPGKHLLIAEQECGCSVLDYIVTLLYGKADKQVFDEVDRNIGSVDPASNKILFLPWMFGERVPIDDPYVRGVLYNVSLSDSRFQILEAIMEGVALNIKWAQIYFEKLLGERIRVLNAVGGGALWDSLCQLIADATGAEVWRMSTLREASAIGAAVIGVKALGLGEFEYVKKIAKPEKVFKPREPLIRVFNEKLKLMINVYKANKRFFKQLNTACSV
ncbi:FGGY-family carbohydrate kinase [Thermosphaera chiliense]|uniref:FGGY-family carbohydrate kinase n=1 Tax=Thermosphaera chiliense TaxID=3402707 RepID=A0A7M1UP13_9CREN|nr:FGGY-family carbohydrate kinase [Thermosphaera aggregans]QOR93980.1 FGGY-family carbohydrate kinase [Thermosphaera aggregans]